MAASSSPVYYSETPSLSSSPHPSPHPPLFNSFSPLPLPLPSALFSSSSPLSQVALSSAHSRCLLSPSHSFVPFPVSLPGPCWSPSLQLPLLLSVCQTEDLCSPRPGCQGGLQVPGQVKMFLQIARGMASLWTGQARNLTCCPLLLFWDFKAPYTTVRGWAPKSQS